MNTKIRAILAAGMLFVTVLPAAACAKKTQVTETVPTAVEVSIPNQVPVEQKTETKTPVTVTPVSNEEITFDTLRPVETADTAVKGNEQKSSAKTVKTTKKTAKKATKKTSKKAAKKTVKKTSDTSKKTTVTGTTTRKSALPELYSFGNSEYVCKGITIKMFIKKNDRATVTITYNSQDRNDRRREIYFTLNGTVDRKTNTLTYTNCRKQELVYTDLGLLSNKVDYKNGKGEITFKKGHKLVWKDSMQHFADSLTFTRHK